MLYLPFNVYLDSKRSILIRSSLANITNVVPSLQCISWFKEKHTHRSSLANITNVVPSLQCISWFKESMPKHTRRRKLTINSILGFGYWPTVQNWCRVTISRQKTNYYYVTLGDWRLVLLIIVIILLHTKGLYPGPNELTFYWKRLDTDKCFVSTLYCGFLGYRGRAHGHPSLSNPWSWWKIM